MKSEGRLAITRAWSTGVTEPLSTLTFVHDKAKITQTKPIVTKALVFQTQYTIMFLGSSILCFLWIRISGIKFTSRLLEAQVDIALRSVSHTRGFNERGRRTKIIHKLLRFHLVNLTQERRSLRIGVVGAKPTMGLKRAGGVAWFNIPHCQCGDRGFESPPARQNIFRWCNH